MKKKIISLMLAALMLFGITAMAEGEGTVDAATHKAVLLIYNADNQLVQTKMLTAENGEFDWGVVPQSSGTKRKVYFIDTAEIVLVQSPDGTVPENTKIADPIAAPTAAPITEPTTEPTAAPTENPGTTAKPTVMPADSDYTEGGLYPKEVDGIYSPAFVEDVELTTDANDEEAYKLTVYFHGKKTTVLVDDDFGITSAPAAYSSFEGKTMDYLEKGDVVCITTNVSGTTVNTVDLITRPAKDDIITGSVDYGTSFEKLVASNGRVAGKWGYITYGSAAGADRYEYAYGVVGKYENGTLTLLNKSGDTLEIDVDKKANVYICDVDGKEYETQIGSPSDITSDIPKKVVNEDNIVLNSDYSYNYALVRLVDKTATDVVLYNNYNN